MVILLVASAASAGSKDNSANAKIQEVIYGDFLETRYAVAERKIRSIIKACGSDCSKATLAKAWMYVGIVRATGKLDDAEEAFKKALQTDPRVKLDTDLESAEVTTAWESAQASMGGGGGDDGGDDDGDDDGDDGGDDDGESLPEEGCAPVVKEVEKGRPIPVTCPADRDAKSAKLRYKEYGSDRWQDIPMRKRGKRFQATIPCEATAILGTVKYYVRTKDREDETIDEFGSRRTPNEIKIVAQTDEEPPAFPGKEPPDICGERIICPPGMSGPECEGEGAGGGECRGGFQSKAWGMTCEESCECENGLNCMNGTCDSASACESDSDCGGGECVSGACTAASKPEAGDEPKNWVGVQFAIDLAWVSSGANACDPDIGDDNITCYPPGQDQQYKPPAGKFVENGVINGGFALATMRIMASYDRLLTPNIDLGARLGFAFRGGPPANGKSFLPVHVEGRAVWRFIPSGILNPYAGLAGGVAQVDAMKEVDAQVTPPVQKIGKLDAWKKVGTGFAAITGGVYYSLSREMAIQANLDAMLFFPSSGFVLEPSVGLVYGF